MTILSKSRIQPLAILLALFSASCDDRVPDDVPPEFELVHMEEHLRFGERGRLCRQWNEERADRIDKARRAGQTAIIDAIKADRDPLEEARKAAEADQWGLISTYEMGGGRAYDVDCVVGVGVGGDPSIVRAYRVVSDVPGSCETSGANGDCAIDAKLDAFAPVYNRAIVSHPRYPNRDFCRVQNDNVVSPQPRSDRSDILPSQTRDRQGPLPKPFEYPLGFADLDQSEPPRTIGEAARRGDIVAMKGFAANDPESLLRIDQFGRTPIVWAMDRGHVEAVAWLLERGASPDGGDCRAAEHNLFEMALFKGNEEAAQIILDATPLRRRREKWTSYDLFAAATGGSSNFLRRMLNEKHEGVNRVEPERGWNFPPATARILAEYRASLCPNSADAAGARITMVSRYGGERERSEQIPNPNPGHLYVTVSRNAGPQYLVLNAYRTNIWHIDLEPGAKVSGVFMTAYDPQRIEGLGRNTPVVSNFIGNLCEPPAHNLAWPSNSAEQKQLIRRIERLLERKVYRVIADQDRVKL